MSDAYGPCPRPDAAQADTSGLLGGAGDYDEDPAKDRSDSLVLPLHVASANLLAWRALVADAAKRADLCRFVES